VGHICNTQLLYFLVFLINCIRCLSSLKFASRTSGGEVMLFDEVVGGRIEGFHAERGKSRLGESSLLRYG